MINKHFFSVVITVFNKEQFIANTITTVLNQHYKNYEIIIVNDGSTDGSLAIINSFKNNNIRVFNTSNGGAAAARNFGIQKAQYDYIALLDGDDCWKPFYLEEMNALRASFPKAKIFGTAMKTEKHGFTYVPSYSFKNPRNKTHLFLNFFSSSYYDSILSSSSCVLHKTVFNEIGYYDTTIKSGQDTDLWIRAGIRFKIAFSTRVCVLYNLSPTGLFSATTSIKDKLDLDKFIPEEKENPLLKKYIDINRFSLVVFCKLNNQKTAAYQIRKKIDSHNLNIKQRIIMRMTGWQLTKMHQFKVHLEKLLNTTISAYK